MLNLRCLLRQVTECWWSSVVVSRPPPHCLVDIPDSVSSLCLKLLSGQLGLKQHDPRSALRLLPTLCVYIYSVWFCTSNTHACLRYERCYIHKILCEKQASKERWGSKFGEISPYSDIVCLLLWAFFYIYGEADVVWTLRDIRLLLGMSHKQKRIRINHRSLGKFWCCNLWKMLQSPMTSNRRV